MSPANSAYRLSVETFAIPLFLLANALLLVDTCRAASRQAMIHLPDDPELRTG
ncbi:hypothetical protein OHA77_40525 [Streptosporangium sp. NBC_01639]|uniref:hypothetical protein n=1 Tax=Streptosporangium sp. NBC_01639 TaxID=2975948 RepID=UPI0038677256|nr:hypothetical protein OHA77_40525 [Streptosporangium sp. NBC_01639]